MKYRVNYLYATSKVCNFAIPCETIDEALKIKASLAFADETKEKLGLTGDYTSVITVQEYDELYGWLDLYDEVGCEYELPNDTGLLKHFDEIAENWYVDASIVEAGEE